MGMSGDFEVAILEGATLVRIGSASLRRATTVIAVAAHASGAILPVLAHAAARRNAILGERAGVFALRSLRPRSEEKRTRRSRRCWPNGWGSRRPGSR